MNNDQLLLTIREQLIRRTVVSREAAVCKVGLPLLEPSGDVINVYVEQRASRLIVHDGGHIHGLLFEAGLGGASSADKRAISSLATDTGLEIDNDSGLVLAYAEEHTLVYWIMEIARTIGVSATLIPTATPRRRGRRRLGPRIARQVVTRLIEEGLMGVIHPGKSVRGITEQERYVDLTYTIPKNPLRLQPDTTGLILTLDLDVADPIAKAHRGLGAATDLAGAAIEGHDIDVRIVHSVGSSNGRAERATKLIKVAAAKHLLRDYSWDDADDQEQFLTTVGQEVAPMLSE